MHSNYSQIARHFTSLDPKIKINLTADYSMESHTKDHQNVALNTSAKQKRAKALLDFERSDNDELGFKKNDIIIVVSQRDEHCWVSRSLRSVVFSDQAIGMEILLYMKLFIMLVFPDAFPHERQPSSFSIPVSFTDR